jgi:micrococcal nuclease
MDIRKILLLAIVATVLFSCCVEDYQERYKAKVVRVIDGDTIVVRFDGKTEKVRLIGVDTPETKPKRNKPFEYDSITNLTYLAEWGLKAKNFTKSILEGKTVELEFDRSTGLRDKYGRLLAYVYINGTDFNALLIKEGYARVFVTKFKKLDHYLKLEREAKEKGIGLWSITKLEVIAMLIGKNVKMSDTTITWDACRQAC